MREEASAAVVDVATDSPARRSHQDSHMTRCNQHHKRWRSAREPADPYMDARNRIRH